MTSYFSASPALSSSSPVLSPSNETLSPSIGSAQRSNALSNRLTSVLSASYADSDIRDALETLDRRGVHNTADTRRQLRLDVQKEVIDCNGEIVKDFGKVADQLKRIGTVITSLNRTCEEMRKHINQAKQETAPVLEEASALMSQKQDTETKQRLLDAFTKHFIVPDEDLVVLTSAEEPVDDHFFDVLARVKRVHHDCEVLLGGENQRLGLEIMEQSSKQLNSAYQKLYKWIQKEFKSLNLEDPQINSSIRRALRVLAERPSLFHSCLDFFAEAREYILSDSFHYALTNAVSAGEGERNVKPIEFSAHDPLRYIGDMLAWVHSAAVSEREALEALFVTDGDEIAKGIKAGISSEPWSRVDGEEDAVFDGQKALNGLVDRDINGVSRSLRQRVELVIQGCDDPVTTYKVVNLLSFYRMTFSRLIGAESNLANVISSLETYTFGHFQTLLGDQVGLVSGDPAALTPPSDLSVPQFLSDALDVLTHLMKAYDASLEGVDSESTSDQENKFTPVLHVAFDPFLDLAKSTASDLSGKTSKAIYQTNILLAAWSTILPYQFACTTHLAPISTSLSTIRMDLLQAQHDFFLETSGLQDLLTALEPFSLPTDTQDSENQPQQPPSLASIASLPAFQPDALSLTSQQLDDFLPSALMDATDNLKRVRNPNLVKSVTEEAVEAFCRDFEFVEGMIIGADEARGITKIDAAGSEIGTTVTTTDGDKEREEKWSLRALFPRTTGEIRVLLS
ncbi:hypothetical protein DTO271G3_8604 [Paecilomyces variotii]|nr:hypothetical protein DTO271G3_8604 [Paecilomyces variotii]